MTKSLGFRTVATCVTAGFLLSACATTKPNRPLTPQEIALREQSKNYTQTVVEGAAMGAILGAVLMAAAGGKSKDIAAGAALGAAAGGLAGTYIAEKKKQYATAEAQYNAIITDVENENTKLASLSDNARQVIANDKLEIDRIDKQIADGSLTMDQAKKDIAAVDSNRQVLAGTLSGLRKKQKELEDIQKEAATLGGNDDQQKKMDEELTKLRSQIASLETEVDTLVERRKVSRVG